MKILCCLLLFLFAMFGCQSIVIKSPVLKLEKNTVNLGEIISNDTIKIKIKFIIVATIP